MSQVNRTLKYTDNRYKNGDRIRIGDVIRISEPDKYGGASYAIYTYIPEFKAFFWVSENILYRYCTDNMTKVQKTEYMSRELRLLKKQLPEIKKIGHISNKVTQDKLIQEWLLYYDHLFFFSQFDVWDITVGEAAIKAFSLRLRLQNIFKEKYDSTIEMYKKMITDKMNLEQCEIIEAGKMIVNTYSGNDGREAIKMLIIVAMTEMYQQKAKND